MKKKINDLLNGQPKEEKTSIIGQFKVVLMGKDFQPLPSYWALIPLKQENKMFIKKK